MKSIKNQNPFKYYLIGTQITVMILSSVFIGFQIDKFFNIDNYYLTIIFSSVTIFYVLRQLINQIKKEK